MGGRCLASRDMRGGRCLVRGDRRRGGYFTRGGRCLVRGGRGTTMRDKG